MTEQEFVNVCLKLGLVNDESDSLNTVNYGVKYLYNDVADNIYAGDVNTIVRFHRLKQTCMVWDDYIYIKNKPKARRPGKTSITSSAEYLEHKLKSIIKVFQEYSLLLKEKQVKARLRKMKQDFVE